jgi:hypothetical protein
VFSRSSSVGVERRRWHVDCAIIAVDGKESTTGQKNLVNLVAQAPEQPRVQTLARFVFYMTSLVAVPGLLASLYVGQILISLFNGQPGTIEAIFLLALPVLGWWLYWTYWLETRNKNRWGKLTWLVSALINSVPLMAFILEPSSFNTPLSWFVVLWGTVMAVASGWVRVLRVRP